MKTTEQIKAKLQECHEQENKLSVLISKCDKEIASANRTKLKLAKAVSKNMKYRNLLISQL